MKKLLLTALTALSLFSYAGASGPSIIPKPRQLELAPDSMPISSTALTYAIKGTSGSTLVPLMDALGWTPVAKRPQLTLSVRPDKKVPADSYSLKITPKAITISSPTERGAYYALQTLRQIIESSDSSSLPCLDIFDYPRFGYRGLMVDVSRHFRPVEFLKKQLDAMARLKMTTMHLHLTDGAGWRMPIESYPRLNSYAAWRPQRSWQDWRDNGAQYCDSSDVRASGGFYTKEELADLIRYAAERHITLLPEIEMPGHSEEVIAAYPELGCNVPGPSSDFCPGKEETFTFLEKVLDETMDVFPSQYIHIGGDEAGKASWKECPDCRRRMDEEGLADIDELQSYLVKRIERYLNSKGRRLIGWDEILEGGLAPEATVMSWRGTAGGLQAISEGHDVIMTPGEFCYLDYSQDAPFREPGSIGGYTPLEKVYSYEPVDSSLSDTDARHLLGLQGNLWVEYVTDDSHAEYMYYPRIYAIAEIGWSSPEKDYPDFRRRALGFNSRLRTDGYNTFDLANEYGQRHESLTPVDHLARGAKVSYAIPYHRQYPAGGDAALVDGIRGGWTYGDRRWQGTMRNIDLTVDLDSIQPLHYIGLDFMHSEGAWVHLPQHVTFSISSDGENFRDVGTVYNDVDPSYPKIMFKTYGVTLPATPARYVRIRAEKHSRPGAWLMTDEIIIN